MINSNEGSAQKFNHFSCIVTFLSENVTLEDSKSSSSVPCILQCAQQRNLELGAWAWVSSKWKVNRNDVVVSATKAPSLSPSPLSSPRIVH